MFLITMGFILLTALEIALSDGIVVVHKSELSVEARYLAIGLAENEILQNRSDSVVAKTLSDRFDDIYGLKWIALVGPLGIASASLQLSPLANTTLHFSYNSMHIVLFRTAFNSIANQTCTLQSALNKANFLSVITKAKTAGVTYSYVECGFTNQTKLDIIVDTINTTLHANYTHSNCKFESTFTNWGGSDSCLFEIVSKVQPILKSAFGGHWTLIIELLNGGSFYRDLECQQYTYYEINFGNALNFFVIENRV